jgi:hypothetical protein
MKRSIDAKRFEVQEYLGPNRLPLLIAIDGADGLGKSSLAWALLLRRVAGSYSAGLAKPLA